MDGTPQPFSRRSYLKRELSTAIGESDGANSARTKLFHNNIIEEEDDEIHCSPPRSSSVIRRVSYTDNVHGNIELEPLLVRIINTPQFERLNGLAQLGATQYVYRTATHTRFAHSVGVCHLAGKLLEKLLLNQSNLNLTEGDILCVKIAGLCHDLGHGPFSHLWDQKFMKKMKSDWAHEKGSVHMFRYLLVENNIDLAEFGLSQIDQIFIEEMIIGVPYGKNRCGRGQDKEFLYDIVNNVRSGLDVDKLDYLVRDSQTSGVGDVMQIDRFIHLPRVCWAKAENNEPHRMICYPDKMAAEVSRLFGHRFILHSKVYQHHRSSACDWMMVDILKQSNDHIRIPGSVSVMHPDGLWSLSECVYDMCAFTKLRDSIIDIIECSTLPELESARKLISRLRKNDIYKFAFTVDWQHEKEEDPEVLKNDFLSSLKIRPGYKKFEIDVNSEELIFEICLIHCGKREKNPVEFIRFYDKNADFDRDCADRPIGHRVEEHIYDHALPKYLCKTYLRVYVKDPSKVCMITPLLERWYCERADDSQILNL